VAKQGGFDPSRLAQASRPPAVVQQILTSQATEASGFTEVRAIGVGGAGGNAINRLIAANVQGISFAVINTDAQALASSSAQTRLRIGERLTGGLGSGGDPARGQEAALESEREIRALVAKTDMVFVTAGMGGGTGTGASPLVARWAKEAGALTVGVVTRPFSFEGARRRGMAAKGVAEMLGSVDALLVVPNDRLIDLSTRRTQLTEAFKLADDVMLQGIRGISDLITTTGLVNVDFADVKAVLSGGGLAHMAMGTGYGRVKGEDAARRAIASPLLETPLRGARALLLNCVGGPDMALFDVNQAAEIIAGEADPEAEIIFGAFVHPRLTDELQITVIAAGLPA
jgi:cell division protein FtsZ